MTVRASLYPLQTQHARLFVITDIFPFLDNMPLSPLASLDMPKSALTQFGEEVINIAHSRENSGYVPN